MQTAEMEQNSAAASEKVHGYEIKRWLLFENDKGFALGHNPKAAEPFATWQFKEDDGARDYEWGRFFKNEMAAVYDFNNRISQYKIDYPHLEKDHSGIYPPMSELKKRLLLEALAEIGFTQAYYIPESDNIVVQPDNYRMPYIRGDGAVFYGSEHSKFVDDTIMPLLNRVNTALTELEKTEADKKVYLYPADHARRHGELDTYRKSNRLNRECAQAIDETVNNNFSGNRLKPCAKPIIDKYGAERVNMVLARTLQIMDYDGRFSRRNRDWAESFPRLELGDGCTVGAHPVKLNAFVTQFRYESELDRSGSWIPGRNDAIEPPLMNGRNITSACNSRFEGMVALVGMDNKVYLGKTENYDSLGHYDNSDKSIIYVSDNDRVYHFLYGDGSLVSQAEALYYHYAMEDYAEFARIQTDMLCGFEKIRDFMFAGIPIMPPDSPEFKEQLAALERSGGAKPYADRLAEIYDERWPREAADKRPSATARLEAAKREVKPPAPGASPKKKKEERG